MRSLTRLAWLRGILALALAAVPLAPLVMATPAMAATPARAALPVVAAAPDDRGVLLPDDTGAVPVYRPTGAALLVCTGDAAAFTARISAFPAQLRTINSTLWTQCQKSGFHTVQAAVDAVNTPGQIIKILPGVYVETPSLAPTSTLCTTLPGPRDHDGALVLSFVQQSTCPHLENLVAVLSKKNLQIEGTGTAAGDVVIDGAYARRTVLRVDRSPGTYLRNFTVEHAIGTAVDVMETDGFAVDGLVARATGGDGVRANGADHGLITDCVAYANGNAGIAVDSSRAPTSRYSVEVRRCQSRDNLLGYSGSAGNAVFAHDNRFTGNAIGVSMGSAADSPTAVGVPVGRPQHRAVFERNVIADNNRDDAAAVRDGTCAKPIAQRGYDQGVVCPAVTVPSGIGVMLRGGNDNTFDNNWIYGNHYAGFLATWLPGFERGSSAPHTQLETSHRNHVFANTWGHDTAGAAAPNGLDVWWDAQGVGTCWRVPAGARTVPLVLPNCTADGTPAGLGIARWVGDPMAALTDDVCTRVDPAAGVPPTDCPWYGAAGLGRVDVKWALGEAVLLGLLVLWLWARVLRGRGAGAARLGLVLVLAGLGLAVYGTVRGATLWPAAALGVLGVGWMCLGFPLRRRGRPGLGVITIGLGVFALLGALDQAVWMLPWIPVAPGVVRLALEIIWVPWAMAAAVSGRVLARARPSRDPLVRYAQALRA